MQAMATEAFAQHQHNGGNNGAGELNPLSCEVCRRRKTKCDRRLPSCTHCIDARVDCHYPEARQRGPQVGYLSILEGRLVATEVALYQTLARLHGSDGLPGQSNDDLAISLQKKYADMPYSAKTAEWNHQPLNGDQALSRWWLERRQMFESQQATNSLQDSNERPRPASKQRSTGNGDMAAPTWTSPPIGGSPESQKRRAPSLSSIQTVDTGEGGLRNMYGTSASNSAPVAHMSGSPAFNGRQSVSNIDPALAAHLGPEQSRKYF
ncbi:hypothetical protein LTR95_000259 [Oleoguttula sp. CCFEE 5521]